MAGIERVEVGAAGCGCPITEEIRPNSTSVEGTERTEHRHGCWDAPSVLSTQDAARIYRAMGRMPYAAGMTPKLQDVTVERVIGYLEELADELKQHAEADRERDEELHRLRDLIRGGRRLLAEMLDKD